MPASAGAGHHRPVRFAGGRASGGSRGSLILGMDAGHPAYPYTGWLQEPLSTDSEPALRSRREQQENADEDRKRATRRQERNTSLMAALDDAGRDPGCWWLVARWLAADDTDNPEAVFSSDLTSRAGWDLLSGPQRQDVLDLGVRYLAIHQPQSSRWAGRNAVPADHADPDWQGVYLLTTLAGHDQERLGQPSGRPCGRRGLPRSPAPAPRQMTTTPAPAAA
jgi:hypothetical protein